MLGVIPEMRSACPIEAGLYFFNLSRASVRSCLMETVSTSTCRIVNTGPFMTDIFGERLGHAVYERDEPREIPLHRFLEEDYLIRLHLLPHAL